MYHTMNEIAVPTTTSTPTTVVQKETGSLESKSTLDSSANNTNKTHEYLDNPNFAPPPGLASTASSLNQHSHLPKYELIRHSGNIMTRFSSKSLLTKSWKPNFWILYKDTLYFFRSKDDFYQWLSNPHLSKDERTNLVKRMFVFKKNTLNLYTLRTKRQKMYASGGYMHNFKLNLHTTYGEAISDNLAGAFGSPNEVDVNELYIIIYSLLEPAISSQHPLACIFQKDSASNGGSTITNQTGSSTSTTKSGFSAVSFARSRPRN